MSDAGARNRRAVPFDICLESKRPNADRHQSILFRTKTCDSLLGWADVLGIDRLLFTASKHERGAAIITCSQTAADDGRQRNSIKRTGASMVKIKLAALAAAILSAMT